MKRRKREREKENKLHFKPPQSPAQISMAIHIFMCLHVQLESIILLSHFQCGVCGHRSRRPVTLYTNQLTAGLIMAHVPSKTWYTNTLDRPTLTHTHTSSSWTDRTTLELCVCVTSPRYHLPSLIKIHSVYSWWFNWMKDFLSLSLLLSRTHTQRVNVCGHRTHTSRTVTVKGDFCLSFATWSMERVHQWDWSG